MNIINNINSKIGMDEITKLLKKYDESVDIGDYIKKLDILPILYYLDLSKLEELGKVI